MPSLLLLVLFASSLFLETVVSAPQESPFTAEPLITAPPALGGPESTAATATSFCGGCIVVAEVAAVIWYSEVFAYNGATAVLSVATGNTTGRSTRTSIITNTETFTFRPGETANEAPLSLTPVTYGSTATLNGATLFSPTPYNVFTAYVIKSESLVDGRCSTETGQTSSLASGYPQKLDDSSGQVTLGAEGEQQFITDFLNLTSCRGQTAIPTPVALVPITTLTSTTTQYHRTVSRVFATSGLTLAPTSTPHSTAKPGTATLTLVLSTRTASLNNTRANSTSEAGSGSITITYPFASAPLVVSGSSTITPDRYPLNLPLYNPTSGVSRNSPLVVVVPTGTGTSDVAILVPTIASGGSDLVVIIPTGTGSLVGNYTATIAPYISGSETSSWRRGHFWTSMWAASLSGVALVMVWL
ncbi:hypothetical protein MMC29_003956 [Sticta canariensis]|nr:hypothetical protein [Sticta canariensis]